MNEKDRLLFEGELANLALSGLPDQGPVEFAISLEPEPEYERIHLRVLRQAAPFVFHCEDDEARQYVVDLLPQNRDGNGNDCTLQADYP